MRHSLGETAQKQQKKRGSRGRNKQYVWLAVRKICEGVPVRLRGFFVTYLTVGWAAS